jgi:hypothetical protein
VLSSPILPLAKLAIAQKSTRPFFSFYKRLKVLQGKTPYEVCCQWFKKKPEIFLRDPTILPEKNSP